MNDFDSTQSAEVLDRTEHVNEAQADELAARVPFPSDLVLSREQEDRMISHATRREEQIESEMGRSAVKNVDWWQDAENLTAGKNSWMGKREMFEAIYHNKVDWRPMALGGIFTKTNLVVPMSRRITRQMVARANSYYFGTDPWFGAKAERGSGDHDLAEKIDQYAKFKLKESKSKRFKEKAVELSFIRGETVMKSVYKKKVDYYQTTTKVLVDVEGTDIRDSEGGYIFENDRWVQRVMVDEETGEETAEGGLVLERDVAIERPANLIFASKRIRQSVTLFDSSESKPVFFKDFLCPLTAETVEDADFCAHLYDMDFMDLAQTYREREILSDEETDKRKGGDQWEATKRSVELLRELAGNDGTPKSAANQSRDDEASNVDPTSQDPVIEVSECYFYFDADGDGIREHIMLVYDRATMLPIFYDYVANITPDGKRPFSVIRPTEVDGRWYGVGSMEMFESSQKIVDLLINRWSFSQSKAGRVTFWNPDKVLQGDRNPNLKLNDGGTYTLKSNAKAEDALSYVQLPDIKHDAIRDMFEFFLQISMNESGVQHANDANMAGLDQAKLATGIRNIEKSGNEMFAIYLSALEPGIEDTLEKEINLIFANLDKQEVFEYFKKGDDPQDSDSSKVLEIDPDEVRDLVIRVNVLMTRYRGEQVIAQAEVAAAKVIEFYTLAPMVQERVAGFFRMYLKALDVSVDVDSIIQPLPMITAPGGGSGASPDAVNTAVKPNPTGRTEVNL